MTDYTHFELWISESAKIRDGKYQYKATMRNQTMMHELLRKQLKELIQAGAPLADVRSKLVQIVTTRNIIQQLLDQPERQIWIEVPLTDQLLQVVMEHMDTADGDNKNEK